MITETAVTKRVFFSLLEAAQNKIDKQSCLVNWKILVKAVDKQSAMKHFKFHHSCNGRASCWKFGFHDAIYFQPIPYGVNQGMTPCNIKSKWQEKVSIIQKRIGTMFRREAGGPVAAHGGAHHVQPTQKK